MGNKPYHYLAGKVLLQTRVSKRLADKVAAAAQDAEMSQAQWMRLLLREYFDENMASPVVGLIKRLKNAK